MRSRSWGDIGRADAARHHPRWVHPLLRQTFDDLQPELAQVDAEAGEFRMLLDHPDHVALRGIGIHAEQDVGRGQIEEAQRVRLNELCVMQQRTQHPRGRRDVDRRDGVAGLGRGQLVADRADSADARGDARHLVERPPLDEFLEAAHLGDVELGVGHAARVVQEDRDLGVAFDAAHRVDR